MNVFWAPQIRASRAIWLLEELSLAYGIIAVDLGDEAARADPTIRAACPFGKVQALLDGNRAIAELAVIAIYLADKYSGKRLAQQPYEPLRDRHLFWMRSSMAVIEPEQDEIQSGWTPNRIGNGWCDFETTIGYPVIFRRASGGFETSRLHPIFGACADRCAGHPALASALTIEQASPLPANR